MTHLVMAVRSAQIPAPYEAFSTFAPVITVPFSVSIAQPTLKLVYFGKLERVLGGLDVPKLGVWGV